MTLTDVLFKATAGTLIAASAVGLLIVAYGTVSYTIVRPAAMRARRDSEAAAALAAAVAAAEAGSPRAAALTAAAPGGSAAAPLR